MPTKNSTYNKTRMKKTTMQLLIKENYVISPFHNFFHWLQVKISTTPKESKRASQVS